MTGQRINYISQGREITVLRKEVPWIGEVPSAALTQATRDLDRAFSNFFAGRAKFPSPRRRSTHNSFRIPAKECAFRAINKRWSEVRIPNLGWLRYRRSRDLAGKIANATVSRDAFGWHVAICCHLDHEVPANDNPAVGIDRGIAVTLALSNGEGFALPRRLAHLERRQRRARRALSRCVRGSKRRMKRLRRLSRISACAARVRGDWQHRASRSVADRFGLVVIEDLKIQNMAAAGRGKRGLNRAILHQGWAGFATKLAYKLEERGGALVKVNPAYTSQTCSDCGAVDADSRKSQARFVCTSCGFAANADTNAAIIILRRSTASMPAEGSGYAPDEPGTCLRAA